ncbi:hypothetical protein [Nocardioides korecus]
MEDPRDVLAGSAYEILTPAFGGMVATLMRGVRTFGAVVAALGALVWPDPDPPSAAREIAELVPTS